MSSISKPNSQIFYYLADAYYNLGQYSRSIDYFKVVALLGLEDKQLNENDIKYCKKLIKECSLKGEPDNSKKEIESKEDTKVLEESSKGSINENDSISEKGLSKLESKEDEEYYLKKICEELIQKNKIMLLDTMDDASVNRALNFIRKYSNVLAIVIEYKGKKRIFLRYVTLENTSSDISKLIRIAQEEHDKLHYYSSMKNWLKVSQLTKNNKIIDFYQISDYDPNTMVKYDYLLMELYFGNSKYSNENLNKQLEDFEKTFEKKEIRIDVRDFDYSKIKNFYGIDNFEAIHRYIISSGFGVERACINLGITDSNKIALVKLIYAQGYYYQGKKDKMDKFWYALEYGIKTDRLDTSTLYNIFRSEIYYLKKICEELIAKNKIMLLDQMDEECINRTINFIRNYSNIHTKIIEDYESKKRILLRYVTLDNIDFDIDENIYLADATYENKEYNKALDICLKISQATEEDNAVDYYLLYNVFVNTISDNYTTLRYDYYLLGGSIPHKKYSYSHNEERDKAMMKAYKEREVKIDLEGFILSDNLDFLGIKNFEEINRYIISSGFGIERACVNLGITDREKVDRIKLIYSENYFATGNKYKGEKILDAIKSDSNDINKIKKAMLKYEYRSPSRNTPYKTDDSLNKFRKVVSCLDEIGSKERETIEVNYGLPMNLESSKKRK